MELTSPLTTLGSISTPYSFYTARDSPSNAADDTSLSSPVDDHFPDEPPYRNAAQLPHELKSHCQIHLEEQLYTAAIHILSGLLSDGTSTTTTNTHPFSHHRSKPTPKPKPALVPPPSQLALLTTLIIHPSFTSRAPETANTHAAAHALSYLRGLLATVGAINANFRAAFDFDGSSRNHDTGSATRANPRSRSRGRGSSRGGSLPPSPSSSSDTGTDDLLTGPLARLQLLFHRRGTTSGSEGDFWSILGWTFRCAAEHPHRWRHWRVWLDFVVSVLEADLDERVGRDKDAGKAGRGGKSARPYPMLRGSLVVGYLEGLKWERRNAVKEVLRAVFAFSDGEASVVADRAAFGEVFDRETVVGVGKKSKRKRGEEAVVDLENDRFGDYLDGNGDEFDSDEEGEAEAEAQGGRVPTPTAQKGGRRRGRKSKGDSMASFTLTDTLAETVPFRLRIFRLLSAASYYLPETLAPVDELYERFTDHVRGLPLPMYRLFVESHPSILPEFVRVSLLRMLIEELLPRNHPDPADVDPENGTGTGVTMLMMRECFLPFAASRITAEDNAKLSLALENLMWFIYSQIEVEYSAGLRRAVEKGIKAREEKVKKRGGGGKGDAADKAAREALARSAKNLRALVDVIAVTGTDADGGR